jgi:hypothetical protein
MTRSTSFDKAPDTKYVFFWGWISAIVAFEASLRIDFRDMSNTVGPRCASFA